VLMSPCAMPMQLRVPSEKGRKDLRSSATLPALVARAPGANAELVLPLAAAGAGDDKALVALVSLPPSSPSTPSQRLGSYTCLRGGRKESFSTEIKAQPKTSRQCSQAHRSAVPCLGQLH
jgi:hypothetical protein